ncbi:MAG: hypothetical protein KO464_02665 [Candidatus Methanofastidiosum sp.]|nr:hypothetical protein [Methanofastidiosum sp.]
MFDGLPGFGSIVGFIFLLLIGAIFIWLGTKLAGIEKASYGKAIICALVLSIASSILGVLLNSLKASMGFFGSLLAPLISLLATLWVIKSIYDTSWGKAFVAWILVFVVIAILIIMGAIGIAGLSSLIK